jgi:nucleoside-diphosphate-sugar epimerase
MLGNIKPKRNYIDVRDVLNSIVKILRKKISKKTDIINIYNQSNYSITNFLKILSNKLKTTIQVIVDKKLLRKFDWPYQTGFNKKLLKLIGYKPEYKLNDSINNILKIF